jgi:hypothetical protein
MANETIDFLRWHEFPSGTVAPPSSGWKPAKNNAWSGVIRFGRQECSEEAPVPPLKKSWSASK